MLFCEARRAARRTSDGRFVPLSEQDPAAWSPRPIREAETELGAAARMGRIGRFQLEAAIQSVHAERAQTGRTDWDAIVVFYEHLVRLAPTLGARVAQAAAVAEARGTAAGLALLDTIDRAAVVHVSALLGRARAPVAAGGGGRRRGGGVRPRDRPHRGSGDPAVPARTAGLMISPALPVETPPLERHKGEGRNQDPGREANDVSFVCDDGGCDRGGHHVDGRRRHPDREPSPRKKQTEQGERHVEEQGESHGEPEGASG